MTDPTTAGEWLVDAIGAREERAEYRKCYGDSRHADKEIAYLAALRQIVELHGGGWCPCCGMDEHGAGGAMCSTLRTVAAIFRDRDGWGTWFGGTNG